MLAGGMRRGRAGRLLVLAIGAVAMLMLAGVASASAECSHGFTNGVTEPSVIEGIFGGSSWSIGGGRSVLEGEGFEFASAVSVGDQPAASFKVLSNTELELTAPAEDEYAETLGHAVEVTVTTPAGTSYSCPPGNNEIAYRATPKPTVLELSPARGPEAGGTTVTISGEGYVQNEVSPLAVTAVDFGATPAKSFEMNAKRELRAVAPAGTGTQQVTVTTAAGTSGTSGASAYEYELPPPAPEVLIVEPENGPASGGNTVTIWGHNTRFYGLKQVWFGTHAAKSFKETGTEGVVQAVAPAGTGTVDVRYETEAGLSAINEGDRYTYVTKPVITAIEPNTSGGTGVVKVLGSGLATLSSAHFGTVKAEIFQYRTDGEVLLEAPNYNGGPGVVDVTVTNAAGTSATGSADRFTYLASRTPETPEVIEGREGPDAGGETVRIKAPLNNGFQAITAVYFGGASASFEVVSEGELKAVVPPGHGIVDVTVQNTKGTSPTGSSDRYHYYAQSVITGLSPDHGWAASKETAVTVHGENFAAPMSFKDGAFKYGVEVLSETEATLTLREDEGAKEIRLENPGGTSAATPADVFTFIPRPEPESIKPSQGIIEGGTEVALRGKYLGYAPRVTFDEVEATVLHSSQEEIVVTAPPHAAGSVLVTVSGENGQANEYPSYDYRSPSELPRFGRCLAVPEEPGKVYKGGFNDKNCKKPNSSKTGKYESTPGLVKPAVSISGSTLTITRQGSGREVLSCSSSSGSGEFEEGWQLAGISIALHGCKAAGHSCQSASTAGEVVTQLLHAVPISYGRGKAVLGLGPVAGEEAISFSCGEGPRTIDGTVWAVVKTEKMSTSLAVPFKSSKKGQKPMGPLGEPTSVWAEEGAQLLVSGTLQLTATEAFEIGFIH